jgi:hypothetical protein
MDSIHSRSAAIDNDEEGSLPPQKSTAAKNIEGQLPVEQHIQSSVENVASPLAEVATHLTEKEQETLKEDIQQLRDRDWTAELEWVNRWKDGAKDLIPKENSLLTSFDQGITDVHEALASRNRIPEGYALPPVVLHEGKEDKFSARYIGPGEGEDKGARRIEISPEILEDMAGSKGELFTFTSERDLDEEGKPLVTVEGTTNDWMYLAGVEEGAHAISHANHPEKVGMNQKDAKSLAEYDANDLEYNGLGWKIRLIMDIQKNAEADETKTDEERVDIKEKVETILKPLQSRLQNAIEFRGLMREERKKQNS